MNKSINLSSVILARNEEKKIGRAIASVSFCDEVVVIDDNSSDLTPNIAKNMGALVYNRALDNDFSGQRNFGLSKAKGNWVLFLDADEEVSKDLANEILKKVTDSKNPYDGFYLKRRDNIWGKNLNYGENGNTKLLRLAKKGNGEWVREVHETWNIKGRIGTLDNYFLHYSHQTLREFIDHVNYMSTLHARSNMKEGKKSTLVKIILWPKLKFINNYILRGGFRDGIYGFVVALIMSFHSYLAWSKIWLMQKKTDKIK